MLVHFDFLLKVRVLQDVLSGRSDLGVHHLEVGKVFPCNRGRRTLLFLNKHFGLGSTRESHFRGCPNKQPPGSRFVGMCFFRAVSSEPTRCKVNGENTPPSPPLRPPDPSKKRRRTCGCVCDVFTSTKTLSGQAIRESGWQNRECLSMKKGVRCPDQSPQLRCPR